MKQSFRTWSAAAAAGALAVVMLAGAAAPAKGPAATEAYQAGMRQFAERDLAGARRSFENAAGRGSGYLGLCAWNMAGQTARLQGDMPAALEAFAAVEKAAEPLVRAGGTVAHHAGLLGELAVLYQAEILESQEKWEAALRRYEHLLQTAAEASRRGESLVQDPYCRERIARLYWRCGRSEAALRELRALLADAPDYPRAPLLRLIVLSLSGGAQGGQAGALAGLSAPLDAPRDAAALGDATAGPPDGSLLGPLRQLADDLPENCVWLPILRLRCGWMLLEAGQQEEACEQFRLASSLADRAGAGMAAVRGYANLSLALWAAHHGDPGEVSRLTQAIAASGRRGHLQEVATQILTGLSWYREQQRKAEPCTMKALP